MKRTILLSLLLAFALSTLVVPEAGAGWLDKWTKKDKETTKVPRYDLFPTMSFYKGVLRQGAGLVWQLDNVPMEIRSDCSVSNDFGEGLGLEEGKKAIVMGTKVGGTIVAYRVRMIKPEYMWEGEPNSSEVTPSEVDPTVGEGTGPQ